MLSRRWLLIAGGLCSSCGAADQASHKTVVSLDEPGNHPAWSRLPDGSQVRREAQSIEGYSAQQVTRCWRGTNGYDCWSVSQRNLRGMASASITAFRSAVLPTAEPTDGYHCEHDVALVESINRGGQQLTSNMIVDALGQRRRAWSRSFTTAFKKDNGVPGEGQWFDCERAWRRLSDGSTETFTTTLVGRPPLM
jgi:hypothetical protein